MRQVLPVVGAAIGAYFGGQTGAQIGWAIGSVIGNAIDPQVIKGPSIGDLAQQTSQEGGPRPIVFALSQPISGNIVFCSNPKIVTKDQQSGKGGGPVTETQHIFRTYAIGICEGPITAIIRVWKNGKLVYDARPGGDSGNNSKFLGATRIFLGGYDQMPSPDIEALVGAGNAPAHRGTCYIVRPNEDLTDVGGAVPQFVFQVLRCEGTFYTSQVYPIADENSVDFALVPGAMTIHTVQRNTSNTDNVGFGLVPGTLTIHSIVQSYTDTNKASFGLAPGSLTINTIVKTYSNPAENESFALAPGTLTINTIVISYSNPAENASFGLVPGTMTIHTA